MKVGLWFIYNRHGIKIEECFYVNGIREGLCKKYYYDGNLRKEGYYKNGLKDDKWYYWFRDGDGSVDGFEYYENGRKMHPFFDRDTNGRWFVSKLIPLKSGDAGYVDYESE